ncbi:SIR2 family protein [Shewanella nanhaiensis]|uniref:SIR2 family protein n=1 Tax=Shewanella nanhaiensis TaxID=2864872 RepID=A0ABS7E952_9GAMM|nr:SIR2 family protein [Shewanella nanhaiensis]MBW8186202.1 SIR2 family protein [Shewanella nanhaiensis]
MCDCTDEKLLTKDLLIFKQGQDSLFGDSDGDEVKLEKIRSKVSDLTNIKNLHFLLGAGASADAIPAMEPLIKIVEEKVNSDNTEADIIREECTFSHHDLKAGFQVVKKHSPKNLENILGTLYSKRSYQNGVGEVDEVNDYLINLIESQIYTSINIDCNAKSAEKSLSLYKKLYQKLSQRNKDLARVNVFTTNNDLLSETALGYQNVNYNNGFSSGLTRTFNPARFSYTFSRKVDSNMEKYEPLENMVYLYKLHGSISWIESDDNSFFNIKEVDVEPTQAPPEKNILIYPTPLKQNKSLGSPYADLIREFQNKLQLQHGVLIVIGYSFSDEHINNAIYAALASNSSLSVIIFGDYHPSENLTKLTDRRIYQVSGEIVQNIDGEEKAVKIHYFEYIVNNLIPDLDRNRDSDLLEDFMRSLKKARRE